MADQQKIGRICFRGDTRDPSSIFRSGFLSRDMKASIKYLSGNKHKQMIPRVHGAQYERSGFRLINRNVYNKATTRNEADPNWIDAEYSVPGDIDSPTAVCVTPRFTMAALFPPKIEDRDTWIYVAHVEKGFNTHGQQVADGLKAVRQEVLARDRAVWENPGTYPNRGMQEFTENSALWPLYAQELATKSIPAKHVIAAVLCRRAWKGKDWTEGAHYIIEKHDVQWNKHCRVDKAMIDAVRGFLQAEPAYGETPGRASGFNPSFKDFRDAAEFA